MGEKASIVEMADSDDEEIMQMMKKRGLQDNVVLYQNFKKYYKLRKKADLSLDCFPREWVSHHTVVKTLCKEFSENIYNEVMSGTEFAIQQINVEIGQTYKLVDVVKVAEDSPFFYLLYFTAREIVGEGDGPVKVFQANVYYPGYRDPYLEQWRFYPDPA